MQVQEFVNQLTDVITAEEWSRLERNDPPLIISSFNRKVLLSMRNTPVENSEVDITSVRNLYKALQRYLNIYMSDCLAGHKWII